MVDTDCIVIGGGIAGISIAYELSASLRVIVLERETQPGYHSTGRSAALFSEIYGNAVIRGLSRNSRQMLFDPPASFSETPFVRRRGALFIASSEQRGAFDELMSAPDVARASHVLDTDELMQLVPVLRAEHAAIAAYEPSSMDIEVHALHQAYIKGMRARGGTLACGCEVRSLVRRGGSWIVHASERTFRAPLVVNAAGAWADEIARLAGVAPLGVAPMRRTAVLVDPPRGLRIDEWPLVIDVEETFYFKPDAGKLLLSPADETPSPACDAQPDELDIALAIHRVEAATTLSIDRVTHRWAGLRSFVADRSPVAGFDAEAEGFFWLCGQGGYGIQTAPALARTAAALALDQDVPPQIAECGVSSLALSPVRLRTAKPSSPGSSG